MNRIGWVVIGLGGWLGSLAVAAAQEQPSVIYRKADRLVVGVVRPPQSVQVELENILQSELGGAKGDYAVASVEAVPLDKAPVVQANGAVVFTEFPELVAKRQARASVVEKLKALGFTDAEVTVLLGR